jgi:hypothetical protein
MENKEWTEPELIVLVRSKPEEAVLSACKEYTGGGPSVDYYYRDVYDLSIPACTGCLSLVGS